MKAPICLSVEVRPVPGTNLAVSAAGDVYGPRGKRATFPGTDGYLGCSVRLPGKPWPGWMPVHLAVLTAWVGPAPAGTEGRHRNGDKADNRLANLSWSTHAVNIADKHAHGTMGRPGRPGQPARVLTAADVAEMRSLWPAVSIRALAERYGVGRTTAGDVVRGKSWRGVS